MSILGLLGTRLRLWGEVRGRDMWLFEARMGKDHARHVCREHKKGERKIDVGRLGRIEENSSFHSIMCT